MELIENEILTSCRQAKDSQQQLLDYIISDDLPRMRRLLLEGQIDVNHVYDHPYYTTALCLAIQFHPETTSVECIKLLLNFGADPFFEDDVEKNPINHAAESGNEQFLTVILDHITQNYKDIIYNKLNIIWPLVQYIKITDNDSKEKDYLNIIKKLIDFGIDVNIRHEETGQTAIYLAAKYGFRHIVATLLNHADVNLDSYKTIKNQTARDIITEQNLYDGKLPDHFDENENSTIHSLYDNIRTRQIQGFKQNYEEIDSQLTQQDKNKLLHKTAVKGLYELVKFLIEKGADKNSFDETLLEKVCEYGYFKIARLVLETNTSSATVSKALLTLLKVKDFQRSSDVSEYRKCLELLLRHKNIKINYNHPGTGKTALHLASLYQPDEFTLRVLRQGASLGSADMFGLQPIADISPDTLKEHLDQCIEVSQTSNDDVNKNIVINITSLLPPRKETETVEDNCKLEMEEQQSFIGNNTEILQETGVLQYMAQSNELKHLLKHPVIMTFLFLKWYHIRMFFYINLGIYCTFFISLLTYIMLGYNNITETEHPGIINLSYGVCLITFLILIVREVGQVIIYKHKYFVNFENWLEMALLIITFLILLQQNNNKTIRQLSAVAIVISAIELLLLIGQYPSLSTNIMMLRTVSYTFFKLLLWYSILLLAFAFSFYTLFQEDASMETHNNDTQDTSEEEQNFFLDPGMSLLKTIVMLTGEFDAGSIKFNTYPIISHLLFVTFVFLIAIVLFNLLNGLAVNDTQIIKNDAELYDQIIRVEHIGHLEKVLLKSRLLNKFPFIQKISVFSPNTQVAEIKIYENQNYKITYGYNKDGDSNGCYRCQDISLGKKIQKAFKHMIQEKHNQQIQKNKEEETNKQLQEIMKKINMLQDLLLQKK